MAKAQIRGLQYLEAQAQKPRTVELLMTYAPRRGDKASEK